MPEPYVLPDEHVVAHVILENYADFAPQRFHVRDAAVQAQPADTGLDSGSRDALQALAGDGAGHPVEGGIQAWAGIAQRQEGGQQLALQAAGRAGRGTGGGQHAGREQSLVEQIIAGPGDARVVRGGDAGTGIALRAFIHRAEFEDIERFPVPADPRSPVEGGARTLPPNADREKRKEWDLYRTQVTEYEVNRYIKRL